MLKINNYVHKRINGDDRLQAFRDILEFNNINVSTNISFGLGEGLIFKFILSYPDTNITTIIGKNAETEQIFCRSIGINIEEHEETNIHKAKMTLINRLKKNIPTIIDVDKKQLYHISDYTNAIHSVVVVGYDEKEDKFAVTDIVSDDPIWIEAKKIEKARNSTSCVFLPKNKWYNLDFSNFKNYMILNTYYSSIKSVCLTMKSRLYNTGINGMKIFYEEFKKIYDLFQNNDLDNNSKESFSSNLLDIGTQIKDSEYSNSFYRDIYSAYLQRLYLFTNIELFNKYSNKCTKIASIWRKLGDYLCCEKINIIAKATYFINTFPDIITMEEEFFTNLYKDLS